MLVVRFAFRFIVPAARFTSVLAPMIRIRHCGHTSDSYPIDTRPVSSSRIGTTMNSSLFTKRLVDRGHLSPCEIFEWAI